MSPAKDCSIDGIGHETRAAQRDKYGLTDLGRMPADIRELAYQWGGTCAGGICLYQVASTDGLTRDRAELRSEIITIADPAARAALLAWLDGRDPDFKPEVTQ